MMKAPNAGLPPACGECFTQMKAAHALASPQDYGSRLFRAGDGKMRVDTGTMSVITDPAAGKSLLLDHIKKEAHISDLPQAPQMPAMPGMPGMPGFAAPTPPAGSVVDLGKAMINGQEAEGKRYLLQKLPPPPGMPAPPPMPELPVDMVETWTSTKLQLPVLTKTTGSFGEQICQCKYTELGEPPAELFQIPADYKKVEAPKVGKLPKLG